VSDHFQYGVDLGTTNSLIAHFDQGNVLVFGNPGEQGRKTLASVVGWRRGRVLVGEKARELVLKKESGRSIVAGFKRRMGTSEAYRIEATGSTVTPVELSTEILKELRRFVTNDSGFDSAVITIPASFNAQQSNATSEAARQAGIKHVALLQEPIAASLAYANSGVKCPDDGKWLVYDLGGGTFDVALIEINEDQLRVIDHEGDNFLGGRDFDALILDELVLPKLARAYTFSDLSGDLKNESGRYNHVYEALLKLAESAKIELSSRESAERDVELDFFEDDQGQDVSETITITRSDLERVIRDSIDGSLELVKTLLSRNKLRGSDLTFVLLVGGSTYIPCVRQLLGQVLETKVRSDIDPTTAIVIGAAYFAGGKALNREPTESEATKPAGGIRLRSAYQRSSRDPDEYFAARVEEGWREGLRYRITRRDGGFDTSWKPLDEKIAEDLPLQQGEYNFFKIEVTDAEGISVHVDGAEIAIAHGKVSCVGQPIPQDISLEKDGVGGNTTLHPMFTKNQVLPAEKDDTFTVNRTIVAGSNERIHVKVYQGLGVASSAACNLIGHLVISGLDIEDTIYKGADIEIKLRLEENQDFRVTAWLPTIDQSFTDVFRPQKYMEGDVGELGNQLDSIAKEIEEELADATSSEEYERARQLTVIQRRTESLVEKVEGTSDDDSTDARLQQVNEKRQLAVDVAKLTADRHLRRARAEYAEALAMAQGTVEEFGSDEDRQALQELLGNRGNISSTSQYQRIEDETSRALGLHWQIQLKRPEILVDWFEGLCERQSSFNQTVEAERLIQAGHHAMDSSDWATLRDVNRQLVVLLPNSVQAEMSKTIGFH